MPQGARAPDDGNDDAGPIAVEAVSMPFHLCLSCGTPSAVAGKLKVNHGTYMDRIINAKALRASLPEIVRRVRKGERFVVLYRSSPAFRLVPIEPADAATPGDLHDDPLFGADALGHSADGLGSADHDAVLYGGRR